MKAYLKDLLKKIKLYHPLQSAYRAAINFTRNKYYRLTYLKSKGPGFTCNFCGASYQKFVPEYPPADILHAIETNHVIAGYGENVYCPNCMSKNRERLVLAVLQHDLAIAGRTILHFSPEKHLFNYLEDKASVTTVDIMPGFYKRIDRSVGHADATALAFCDESFDMIIANHILEHIPKDTTAMKEMWRVLKKNGVAILQVPYSLELATTLEDPLINDPAKQAYLFGQKDHVRIYALQDYLRRLEISGFKVKVLSPEYLKKYAMHAIQDMESLVMCFK
jgi:SAM-dependent methyltransferase